MNPGDNAPRPTAGVESTYDVALSHWNRIVGSDEEFITDMTARVIKTRDHFSSGEAGAPIEDPKHFAFMEVIRRWAELLSVQINTFNQDIPQNIREAISAASMHAVTAVQGQGYGDSQEEFKKRKEIALKRLAEEEAKGFDRSPEKTIRLLLALFKGELAARC